MKQVLVTCWEIKRFRDGGRHCDLLYVTYPEENQGHDLITCLTCGKIYAVTVALEVYVGPPLNEKVKEITCLGCGKQLENNFSYYPDKYVINGKVFEYKKSDEFPPDEEAVTKEFPGIYEKE